MIVISSNRPPPVLPPLAPPEFPRSRRMTWIAIAVVVILVLAGVGAYFFVLAPKFKIVQWTHSELPVPTSNVTVWLYSYNVVVGNSGYLDGRTTIICEFSFNYTANGTLHTKSYEGSLRVDLKSGEQREFPVQVVLPGVDAIVSTLSQDKTWSVRLD